MKIGVRKSIVILPAILVDKSYFDLLLEVNWIRKLGFEFNFDKSQVIINGKHIKLIQITMHKIIEGQAGPKRKAPLIEEISWKKLHNIALYMV